MGSCCETDSVIARGEPQFFQIITTISLQREEAWELQFRRLKILTIEIKLANDAKVQARTLYSQTAVWV